MKSLLLVALLVAQAPKADATKLTDAQLLKAERHKTAVLQVQVAKLSIEQRMKDLQAEETALSKELCGEQVFDWQTDACVPKVDQKPVK